MIWNVCTVNDEGLDVISSNLQFLLHRVEGDLLVLHRHAHKRQQTHLGHVLLMREACTGDMQGSLSTQLSQPAALQLHYNQGVSLWQLTFHLEA